jgi:hypothetical protein
VTGDGLRGPLGNYSVVYIEILTAVMATGVVGFASLIARIGVPCGRQKLSDPVTSR